MVDSSQNVSRLQLDNTLTNDLKGMDNKNLVRKVEKLTDDNKKLKQENKMLNRKVKKFESKNDTEMKETKGRGNTSH